MIKILLYIVFGYNFDTLYISDHSKLYGDITYYDIASIEGCTYEFIVPGRISGPTIGTGLDIGAMGKRNIKLIFKDIVSDSVLNILLTADGVRGNMAKIWIRKNNISITKYQAVRLSNRLIKYYWKPLSKRYTCVDTMKQSAKLGILSYAIHVGSLYRIKKALSSCNYMNIASAITKDDRNTSRREVEAFLIMAPRYEDIKR